MERICKMTIGWFSTKTEWLFLKIPTSFLNSYGSFMILILVGILNYCKHTRDQHKNSIGLPCIGWYMNMFLLVMFVKEPMLKLFLKLDSCSHYPFHAKYGMTSSWTSLKAFQPLTTKHYFCGGRLPQLINSFFAISSSLHCKNNG